MTKQEALPKGVGVQKLALPKHLVINYIVILIKISH